MGRIVMSGPQNITLDGVVQDPDGKEGFELGGWFAEYGGEDLEPWGAVALEEALHAEAWLLGRRSYEFFGERWRPRSGALADRLNSMPKYVVSSTRKDFPWTNSHHIAGDLRTGVQKLKDATPAGVLLGSGKLATELDRLDLIDEYQILVHPRIAGHGPTLYQSGLPSTRRLELVSAKPLRSGAVAMHYRRAR